LDEWLASAAFGSSTEPQPVITSAPSPRWSIILAGLVLAGLAIVAGLALTDDRLPRPIVTAVRIYGHSLEAIDDSGKVLWTHQFRDEVRPVQFIWSNRRLKDPVVVDLDGDGQSEVVAGVHVLGSPSRRAADAIYCWDSSGALRWKYEPAPVLSFAGGAKFGPSWLVADIAASRGPGGEVWASFTDGTWWADFVSRISSDGEASIRLVHGGIVYRLQPVSHSGRELVLGAAISNHHGSVGLIAIDASAPAARWPVEPSAYQCVDCAAGAPARYVLLPPSDLNRAHGASYNHVRDLRTTGDGINLLTTEEMDPLGMAARVFRFTPDANPIGYAPTDGFTTSHRLLESSGALDHPVERCEDAARPLRVRVWMPDAGWRETIIPVEPFSSPANQREAVREQATR
jgi:hypothetical protein